MMGSRQPPEGRLESLATSIAESLFGGGRPEDILEGLYLDDVQLEIDGFEGDARLLSRLWERADRKPVFPMIRQGDSLAPIALRQLVSPRQFLDPDNPPPVEAVSRVFGSVVPVAMDEARNIFRGLVHMFLLARIHGVVDFFQGRSAEGVERTPSQERSFLTNMPTALGASVPAVGFRVDVATKSSHVRIHSSLKIRRNWSYFGFYTGPKPVVGGLLGGIYEFGVERIPAQVDPDSGQFDIPYKTLSPRLLL